MKDHLFSKTLTLRTAPLFLLILVFSAINGMSEESKEIKVFSLRLRVPAEVEVDVQRPQADFAVLEFTTRHHVILNGYLGNHPTPRKKLKKTNKTRAGSVEIFTSTVNGRISKEVKLDRGETFPRYIHLWYNNLSPSDSSISEKIIEDALN